MRCRSRPSGRPGTADERLSCRAVGEAGQRGCWTLLSPEPRTFKAKELWEKKGAVIMAVRRPGCFLCREVSAFGDLFREKDPRGWDQGTPAGTRDLQSVPLWSLISTGSSFVICSRISLDLFSVSVHLTTRHVLELAAHLTVLCESQALSLLHCLSPGILPIASRTGTRPNSEFLRLSTGISSLKGGARTVAGTGMPALTQGSPGLHFWNGPAYLPGVPMDS